MNTQFLSSEIKKIVKLLPHQLISPVVFLWTYPLSIIVAAFIAPNGVANVRELGLWLLIGFLSHSAMYPFVVYGKSGKSLGLQIALVLSMGIVRGSVIALLAPIFGLEDSLTTFARILNSALAVFYWNQAGSIIVEYGSSFKRRVKELLNEILEKQIIGMPDAARESSRELVAIIGRLQERIVEIVGDRPTNQKIQEASQEIDVLINNHIRPLSQSSWRDGELTWIRAGFVSVIKRVLSSQRIPVAGVIILIAPFTFVAQITRIGYLATLLVQCVWISITSVIYKVVYRESAQENIYSENLRFLSAIALVSYPITFLVQVLLPLSDSSSTSEMVQGYLVSAFSQIFLMIIGLLVIDLHDDQEFAFEFLRNLIRKGQLEPLLEKTRTGNSDSDFAQYLHAEVQSQLLACKLLLLKAAESDFELFSPKTTQQIVDRMEKIKQPYVKPASRVPAQRIEELKLSWAGLANISAQLIPELTVLKPYSDITSQLIEEAIVNSIRHGGARNISISSSKAGSTLEISVIDDGDKSDGKTGAGLGTILFETFAQSWSLQRNGEETELIFTVDISGREKIS